MHIEAYNGFAQMLRDAEVDTQMEWNIFDFGGRNINGSVRDQLPNANWYGVDIVEGPDVDLVQDLTHPWDHAFRADIVVSTELLEHVENWQAVISTASEALDPNGPQWLFLTCASTGRRRHGASGEHVPPPGEWYGNVDPEDLKNTLFTRFTQVNVKFNPNPGDAYAWATGLR